MSLYEIEFSQHFNISSCVFSITRIIRQLPINQPSRRLSLDFD